MNDDRVAINREGLERLISLIPEMESRSGSWGEHDITSDGNTVFLGPYKFSDITGRVLSYISTSGLIRPFDWGGWQEEAERICNDPDLIAHADLLTVRKLLTLHVRKERFCEGHFAAMCGSGVILLLLKRLKALCDAGEVEAE
ncbi:MAG: DUF6508 domain-containing protein [Candidatus Krumholzibacteriales bacterium]